MQRPCGIDTVYDETTMSGRALNFAFCAKIEAFIYSYDVPSERPANSDTRLDIRACIKQHVCFYTVFHILKADQCILIAGATACILCVDASYQRDNASDRIFFYSDFSFPTAK